MKPFPRLTLPLTLLVILIASSTALALRPCVVDGGDVFDPATIARVNETLRAIKTQSGRDLMVETYPAIPEELRQDLERKGENRFYNDWVTQRARALGVNGIFILVSMQPRHLQVGVGKVTSEKFFGPKDRDELVRRLQTDFKAGQFDKGLVGAVEFAQARLQENARAAQSATQGSGGGSDFGAGGAETGSAPTTRPGSTTGPGTEPRHDTPTSIPPDEGPRRVPDPDPRGDARPTPQPGSDLPPPEGRAASEREKSAGPGLTPKL